MDTHASELLVRPSDKITDVAQLAINSAKKEGHPVNVVCGGVFLFTADADTNPLQLIERHMKECAQYPSLDPERIGQKRKDDFRLSCSEQSVLYAI